MTYEDSRSSIFVDAFETAFETPAFEVEDPARPTEAELEILTVLWSLGPSTVRDVHESISRRKPTQYTTVLKMLQIMVEKRLVERNEEARAHVYQASRPREWTQRQIAGDLLERAFGGSARNLVVGALSARKTSKEDLAEIRKLLDKYEKGAGKMGFAHFLADPLLSGPIVDALSRTLFHSLWEGALIALALVVAIRVFRPSSASIRYGLACTAMLAIVAAFAATFAIALASCWPHDPAVAIQANAPRIGAPPPVPFAWPETSPTGAENRLDWIVPVWLLGAGLFSLRTLAAWIGAMRLKRSGAFPAGEVWRERLAQLGETIRVSRPVTLLESCLTDVPVVVGFLRPAILVPAALFTSFPPDQLELILIHELAHIRRSDYLINLLQSIVEDVLFYHPAVWWISSVMRAERENCCDDIVIAETHNARKFAATLAELEQSRWAAHDAAMAVNGGHLMNRVRRLLEGQDCGSVGLTPCAAPVFFASLLPVILVIASVSHAQSVATELPFPAPPAPRPPVLMAQAPPAPSPAPQPAPAAAQPDDPYAKWLNQEVVYIILDDERKAFKSLRTDEERQQFIEQFWLRRDPTPSTPENEYQEEHYRRIAYANENFGVANGLAGWKTDRGMIYIKYGPPDERDEHLSGGAYQRPAQGGRGSTVTFPFERWSYRSIEGLGNAVTMEFVDPTMTGEFSMTIDPSTKDALLNAVCVADSANNRVLCFPRPSR